MTIPQVCINLIIQQWYQYTHTWYWIKSKSQYILHINCNNIININQHQFNSLCQSQTCLQFNKLAVDLNCNLEDTAMIIINTLCNGCLWILICKILKLMVHILTITYRFEAIINDIHRKNKYNHGIGK